MSTVETVDKTGEACESPFMREFVARGFLHQCTDLDYIDKLMMAPSSEEESVVSAYLGFDATADSLHVGSLLQIMILRLLQKHGHRPVVLIGGGTTKVGDPSGKDESRKLLDDATIDRNAAGIAEIFRTFLSFEEEEEKKEQRAAVIVNNKDWLEDLKYVEFLRDFGPHFSVNRMLSFDSVKTRLTREQPLSFLEFNYMIFQAYDFLELSRRQNVRLQLGGSDQWGNIVCGCELARRVDGRKVIGMTAPLVTTSDGRKMGKTAEGAVWLSKSKLPAYDYWQFWRNVNDDDVKRFLKFFTDLDVDLIDGLAFEDAPSINAAKRMLADETTGLLHGRDVLPEIHRAVDDLFAANGNNNNIGSTDALPKLDLTRADFDDNDAIPLVDLLIKVHFAKSKNEARRLIQGGGARLQNIKVDDVQATLTRSAFDSQPDLRLSSGKKKHAILRLLEE